MRLFQHAVAAAAATGVRLMPWCCWCCRCCWLSCCCAYHCSFLASVAAAAPLMLMLLLMLMLMLLLPLLLPLLMPLLMPCCCSSCCWVSYCVRDKFVNTLFIVAIMMIESARVDGTDLNNVIYIYGWRLRIKSRDRIPDPPMGLGWQQ